MNGDRRMTYSKSVEDIATSVKSKLCDRVTVDFDPADLHVARSDHFKLIVPSQWDNEDIHRIH